jgi:hypothetical protein
MCRGHVIIAAVVTVYGGLWVGEGCKGGGAVLDPGKASCASPEAMQHTTLNGLQAVYTC